MTDQPTPPSSLEEAWKDHRATIDATLPVVLNQARRDFNAGWAAARAEVIREVEALQARVKVLEDGLYRAKARAERHMKGPDAYYGIAMECEKALRALSQGGEADA